MQQLETEIKFYRPDPKSTRKGIVNLGALTRGRVFEYNVRFEDENQTLIKRQSLLRLRRDQKVSLTFKSPPSQDNTEFKVLSELEVEIGDFDTMHRILAALGFHRKQIYEKWRETLVLDQLHFCLDEMPYGNFLEIEGQPQDIKHVAAQLNLPWNQRILINYLQIFEFVKDQLRLEFTDITFDNFNDIEVNLMSYLDMLVAKA